MCGIWGIFPVSKRIKADDMALLEQITYMTALRGNDSTGIAVISEEPKSKPRTLKMVGGPDYLLNSQAWDKVADFAVKRGVAMFGHGRASTKGAILAKNAHPHTVDHITLVHNGTINFGLDEDYKLAKTDNDSLALCHAIAKEGLVEALYKILGAYSLIVYNSNDNTVQFVSNGERPLHMVEFLGRSVVMSEYDACEYIAKRNTYAHNNPKVVYFPKNVIYTLDLDTGKMTKDDSLVEKLAKKLPPPVTHTPATGGDLGRAGTSKGTRTKYFNSDLHLLCCSIEAMPEGKTFRYVFLDPDNTEYVAMSSYNYPEKMGKVAYTREVGIMEMVNKSYNFVRFRELRWEDDEKAEQPKKEEEDLQTEVRFRNGRTIKREQLRRLLKKEDCQLCGGSIEEDKAADTIMTYDNSFICHDCVHQGRHFAFGFGQ